jgi:hypothetical protein
MNPVRSRIRAGPFHTSSIRVSRALPRTISPFGVDAGIGDAHPQWRRFKPGYTLRRIDGFDAEIRHRRQSSRAVQNPSKLRADLFAVYFVGSTST